MRHSMALDLDVRSDRSHVLDFSLLVEHSTLALEVNGATIDTNLQRIGILSFDVPASGPSFGLALGYAFSDFSTNPVYSTHSMDGYYIGIAVQGYLMNTQVLSLLVTGQYLYQSVNGSEADDEFSLAWNEISAQLIFGTRVFDPVLLFGGASYGDVDATYRQTGSIHLTDNMATSQNTGFVTGLRYAMNRREFISVYYQHGYSQGGVLQFQKYF